MSKRSIESSPQGQVDTGASEGLEALLGPGSLRTTFQPIIDLQTSEVTGFEAQVRGPVGSSFDDPAALASAARSMGMTVDLDVVRWRGALAAAASASLPRELPLFIAVDPDSLMGLPDLHDLGTGTAVLQLDETALIRRPAHLLRTVAQVRQLGWAIAVDHVGVRPESLALLPLLEPDVIKLDRTLINSKPNRFTARVVNAVAAQTERTGAIVMAEGIDTQRGRRSALAMGARVGEGRLFDGANNFRSRSDSTVSPLEFHSVSDRGVTPVSSPFQLAAAGRDPRPGDKRLLIEISKSLESMASESSQTALLLGAFQYKRQFTMLTSRRWELMATNAALVGALAVDMDAEPASRVRGAKLAEGDPVRLEWDVVVLTPHFSAVLAARDRGDDGPDMEREFDYVLSHDRTLAVECARSLLQRLPAERTGN